MESNERKPRKESDAEVALWERIKDGAMFESVGSIELLKVPVGAFRAWCLTVIMQYTDWLTASSDVETKALWAAAQKYLDTEEEEFALEIQTLPEVTQVEKNRAHNATVLARDKLAALLADEGDNRRER